MQNIIIKKIVSPYGNVYDICKHCERRTKQASHFVSYQGGHKFSIMLTSAKLKGFKIKRFTIIPN